MKKRRAFSLGEVITTLTILGIVASMTIPVLQSDSEIKEATSRLKKLQSNLEGAVNSAIIDNSDIIYWFDSSKNSAANTLTFYKYVGKHLNVETACGTSSGCWNKTGAAKKIGKQSGQDGINFDTDSSYQKVILLDGTPVAFKITDATCSTVSGTHNNVCGEAWVNIRGKNNKIYSYGRAVFNFLITSNGIKPAGENSMTKCLQSGEDCTAWVILNENEEYRFCDGLEWGGKTKCGR